MNDKTGGSRGPRRAGALAVVAAAAALTAACGSSPASSGDPAATASATFRAELAFAHCMQTHGMPNFPDPTNANQGFGVSGQLNGNASGPAAQAHNSCAHLLPRGSSTSGGSVTQTQINEALKIVQCLRAHGEPTFPDPTVQNGSLHITVKPGVLQSSQFQSALSSCRSLIPKGVNFP